MSMRARRAGVLVLTIALFLTATLTLLLTAPSQRASALTWVTTINPLIGESPKQAVASPDGTVVYVLSEGSFQVIDIGTNTVVNTITPQWGGSLVGIQVSSDNQQLYVVVTDSSTGESVLITYSTADLSQAQGFVLGNFDSLTAFEVFPDGESILLANAVESHLEKLGNYFRVWIDENRQWPVTSPLFPGIAAATISADGSTVYGAESLDGFGYVSMYDAETLEVISRYDLGGGTDVQDVALANGGDSLLVTDWECDCLYIFNDVPNGLNTPVTVSGIHDAQSVTVGAIDTAYVTGSDGVTAVNVPGGGAQSAVAAGTDAWGVAFSAQSGQLYVTNAESDGYVTVLQTPVLTPGQQTIVGFAGDNISTAAFTAAGFTSSSGLTYSIEPELPFGMNFDATTGVVSGEINAAFPEMTFQINGRASDGETATSMLTLSGQPVITANPPSATVSAGSPYATGYPGVSGFENCSPTFQITSGAVPTGLTLNTETGQLSGTPTVPGPPQTTTITGACGGFQASFTQSITVTPGFAPMSQYFEASVGHPYSSTPLVGFGLGSSVSYSITPALPPGLSFDATTGVVAGTPTAVLWEQEYSISVVGDAGLQSATLTLRIVPSVNYPGDALTPQAGVPYTSAAPTLLGFLGPVTLSSTELPAGCSIDATTGVVSCLISSAVAPFTVVVQATDRTYDTNTPLTFSVAARLVSSQAVVAPTPGAPVSVSYTPFGFHAPVTFSVSPALPIGLSLNAQTGELTGVLTALAPQQSYIVSASDGTFTASTPLTIRVISLTPTDQSISAESGVLFHSEPIIGTNFSGPLRFSVSPSLPGWAQLDTRTGVMSGTPTSRFSAHTFTITGTDGSFSAEVTATLFVAPQLTPTSQDVIGAVGEPLQVPFSARSFQAPVHYSVSPELPAGLTLDAASGMVSGTPTVPQLDTTYRIHASDGDVSANAQLTLRVVAATVVTRDVITYVTATPSPNPSASGPATNPPQTPTPSASAPEPTPSDAAGRETQASLRGFGAGALLAGVLGAAGVGATIFIRRRRL